MAAIFNATDVGRTGPRAQRATLYFDNPFILLLFLILYYIILYYIILQNCVF